GGRASGGAHAARSEPVAPDGPEAAPQFPEVVAMRIARAVRIPGVALATILVFVAGAAGAADRDRTARDRFWTAPDAAAYPVASIALLPAATYDGSVEARRVVEQAVSQALRGSRPRRVSALLARGCP